MEIVMSKFKVGDKVKRINSFGAVFNKDKIYTVAFVCAECLSIENVLGDWSFQNFELAQDDWTIHNNDKPLSELTDEQLTVMVKHKLIGGKIERYDTDNGWKEARVMVIDNKSKYRAKQKSGREIFIEKGLAVYESEEVGGKVEGLLGAMYDADFKAPKDGE